MENSWDRSRRNSLTRTACRATIVLIAVPLASALLLGEPGAAILVLIAGVAAWAGLARYWAGGAR